MKKEPTIGIIHYNPFIHDDLMLLLLTALRFNTVTYF